KGIYLFPLAPGNRAGRPAIDFVNTTPSYCWRFGRASRTGSKTVEESFHMPITAKKSKRKAKGKKKRTVRKVGARGAARKTRGRKGAKKTARRKTRRSKKSAAAPAAM